MISVTETLGPHQDVPVHFRNDVPKCLRQFPDERKPDVRLTSSLEEKAAGSKRRCGVSEHHDTDVQRQLSPTRGVRQQQRVVDSSGGIILLLHAETTGTRWSATRHLRAPDRADYVEFRVSVD